MQSADTSSDVLSVVRLLSITQGIGKMSSNLEAQYTKDVSDAQKSVKSDPSFDMQEIKLKSTSIGDHAKNDEERAEKLEKAFARVNAPIKVSFDGEGNSINFQIIETTTGKILRKFPPPAAQSMIDRLDMGLTGAIISTSA